MRSTHAPRRAALAGASLLALLLCSGRALAQTAETTPSVETIDVTGRPISDALDVIQERYGVAVDYSDPVYDSTVDTQLLWSLHGKRLLIPILIPRIWTLQLRYSTVGGKPVGGMTALIRQLLARFAAQGGSVFGVRELATRYGPRWEVYPVRARNSLATFVDQTDFLSATVDIPAAQRTPGEMLELIAQQLTRAWGRRFWVASDQSFSSDVLVRHTAELGADNISARQAIVDLMGPGIALRMFYGPDDDSYAINIVNLPYQPPPRPPTPAPVPATVLPTGPRPPSYWLVRARTPQGILEIQGGLAKAGYLHTAPTTQWDAEAIAALRQFQAAVGFPPTGEFDYWTAGKLAAFLPQYQQVLPAKGPMDPALAYWLGSTRRGCMEIQEALTKAGFYSGPTTGAMDLETREALKAFQTASGLTPNGVFDYQTAEKLAPLLPKPN